MALPLPAGLTPPELAFLCEMELVTVIPRQRMDSLPLLSIPTPALFPNRSTPLPLYLALLLHSQRRAIIVPPPWLSPDSLSAILSIELESDVFSPSPTLPSHKALPNASIGVFNYTHSSSEFDPITSPPFLPSSTIDLDGRGRGKEGRLPYHWLELAELLLAGAPDSFVNFGSDKGANGTENVRRLLRDIREVRRAKLREGMTGLEGGGVVNLRGIGGMEVVETRGFVAGVQGGLRAVGGSREGARKEREDDGNTEGDGVEEEDEMEMEI